MLVLICLSEDTLCLCPVPSKHKVRPLSNHAILGKGNILFLQHARGSTVGYTTAIVSTRQTGPQVNPRSGRRREKSAATCRTGQPTRGRESSLLSSRPFWTLQDARFGAKSETRGSKNLGLRVHVQTVPSFIFPFPCVDGTTTRERRRREWSRQRPSWC